MCSRHLVQLGAMNYITNTSTDSRFIGQLDWRKLPKGVTFREPVVAFRAPRSGRDARDARIRNALYLPRRVPSRRQHYLDARCRHFLTAALLDECAFPTANYSFRPQEDPPAGRLVAAPATPRGKSPSGHSSISGAVTFPTPKRPSTSPELPTRPSAMAISCLRSTPTPRAGRRPRRRPHVQLVHGLFLCRRQPHPSGATAEKSHRFRHRLKITANTNLQTGA